MESQFQSEPVMSRHLSPALLRYTFVAAVGLLPLAAQPPAWSPEALPSSLFAVNDLATFDDGTGPRLFAATSTTTGNGSSSAASSPSREGSRSPGSRDGTGPSGRPWTARGEVCPGRPVP